MYNSSSLTDINKHAEDFYCELLNLLYGYNLKNINFDDQNAAAIDLGDQRKKIAIQVTSTASLSKIKKTVKLFIEKKLYTKYNRLIVLNIARKSRHAPLTLGSARTIKFKTKGDVWGIDTLIKDIQKSKIKKIDSILAFLKENIESLDKSDEKKTKHDCALFEKSEASRSPQDWDSFFYLLWNDHSFRTEEFAKVREYANFLVRTENEFLNPDLQKEASALSKSLTKLLNWTMPSFHIYPKKQVGQNCRLCLYPFWNIDRGAEWDADNSQKYNEAGEELEGLISEVKKAYTSFRQAIKRNLYI